MYLVLLKGVFSLIQDQQKNTLKLKNKTKKENGVNQMKKLFKTSFLLFTLVFFTTASTFAGFTETHISPSQYGSKAEFEQALKRELHHAAANKRRGKYLQDLVSVKTTVQTCIEKCCDLIKVTYSPDPNDTQRIPRPFDIEYRIGSVCNVAWALE